ncbi:bifunctional metallophosphatase/5'-nucleotidase [Clostridium algidicarnis]|uniref:bifunctional metallophosphatase/5'-nucleotidase n=1 Tax=Clostridium algidicarnis TaxID=37659 RepID=UPI001C0DE176|nr:5'-nucleotidase C-terminal domain-containing protein [Clostridium algidicarnis]MBU3194076.1 5'-nucleotidase C-terminal domain-containing protein [Clostridium algidicarnis]
MNTKKILSLLVTLSISLSTITSFNLKSANAETNGDDVTITILQSSDVHGRFMPWDYSADEANTKGSMTQISSIVKDVRSKSSNVILVDAGDAIQDNSVETFNKGAEQPMVTAMNYLNYDVWAMGNHEFNFGLDTLKNVTNQFKTGQAIVGNLYNEDGTRFMPAYSIVERNGIKVGVIGMTTPLIEKFEAGTDHLKGVHTTDPVEETKKVVKELEGKVDVMVGLIHMGEDNENEISNTGITDLANAVPELSVIFAGHMHKQIDGKLINGVLVTEPSKYGERLSKVDLTFKKENDKYVLKDKKSNVIDVSKYKSDKDLEAKLQPFHNTLRDEANKVIGELKVMPLVPNEQIKGIPEIQIDPTALTTFFNEVQLYYSKADAVAIGIENESARLDVGPIKKKDIAFNYRYTGGETTVYEVSGKDLKDYMEWSAAYFNQLKEGDITPSFNPSRRNSKYSTNDIFGGINYNIDLSKPAGNRIVNLTYRDGKEIKHSDTLKLGLNSYRMDQLLSKGGALEGRSNIKKLWSSKDEYGEDAGTIRNRSIDYIMNVKGGIIDGHVAENWSLLGIDKSSKEYDLVTKLVQKGILTVPTSEDGKYTNVASININDIPKEELDNLYTKNEDDNELPITFDNNNNNNNNHKVESSEPSNDSSKTNINYSTLPKTGSPIGLSLIIILGLSLTATGVLILKRGK